MPSPPEPVVSTSRPRLLFLTQLLPYPPDYGAAVRTYHLLRLLAGEFEVTALCFERGRGGDGRGREAAREALGAFGAVEAFAIPQEHSRIRLVVDHLRSVLSNRIYTAYAYESAPFRERLRQVLDTENFDLVHVDSLDLCGYLPLLRGVPVVCGHHNVESQLLRRRAASETSVPRRLYLAHQARLMAAEERRRCGGVALNVVVSEADQRFLEASVPRGGFAVVPNGVDTDAFRPELGSERGLVYVGGMSWWPNHDALRHFCADILPLLSGPDAAPVRWVGQATPEQQRHFRDRYGIELTGHVADTRPYIRDAACYVVPLRVGGGTRLKILEAWAMGKAVVSTSCGCEGLAAADGDNILIRDEPAAFAAAVQAVLADTSLRQHLGARARETVERLYGWDTIGVDMLRAYDAVLRRHGSRGLGPVAAAARG